LAFDQVGKSLSDYKPGINWCTKCKVEADKKFKKEENTYRAKERPATSRR